VSWRWHWWYILLLVVELLLVLVLVPVLIPAHVTTSLMMFMLVLASSLLPSAVVLLVGNPSIDGPCLEVFLLRENPCMSASLANQKLGQKEEFLIAEGPLAQFFCGENGYDDYPPPPPNLVLAQ
jgi:hypothetical protein